MKRYTFVFLCAAYIFVSCAGQKGKIIFRPDSSQDIQIDSIESWQIIESENGQGENGIPEWVRRYFDTGSRGIESLKEYDGKYVFVGENQGENINVLRQWANGFTEIYDFPRLVAARVERRLVSSASLYPDDEYGQYFEYLMKKVSDGEYPGATKEKTYWVKRMRLPSGDEYDDDIDTVMELYEYLILVSIDNAALQGQLRQIMTGIKTTVSPTREQAAAVNKIQQTFFEDF